MKALQGYWKSLDGGAGVAPHRGGGRRHTRRALASWHGGFADVLGIWAQGVAGLLSVSEFLLDGIVHSRAD